MPMPLPPRSATRRQALHALARAGAAAPLLGFLAPAPAATADFPSRTVRLVVPFAAGGLADVLARLVGAGLQPAAPQGVIVENRLGAGGGIGADFVYKSEPDGHTLLVSSPGPIAINQGLYPNLPYDPTRWAPVTVLASVPNALIVSPGLPVKDAREFIAWAKAHPGQVTYATQGNGTTSHLTAKLFESLTGSRMVQVPYKGDTPALTDLAGGQVDAFFGSVGAALQLHKAGKVRLLAVADGRRARTLPDAPTFAELGLPGMRSVTWYAMVAPPGTPLGVRARIAQLVADDIAQPATRQKLLDMGVEPVGSRPEQAAAFLHDETERWQKVIRDAGVKLE